MEVLSAVEALKGQPAPAVSGDGWSDLLEDAHELIGRLRHPVGLYTENTKLLNDEAAQLIEHLIRHFSPEGTPDKEIVEALPADVVRLVIAARVVAFEDQGPDAIKELDEASEAFADRIPWDRP